MKKSVCLYNYNTLKIGTELWKKISRKVKIYKYSQKNPFPCQKYSDIMTYSFRPDTWKKNDDDDDY